VEPFCGGIGVTLTLSPERALLNDVNPHIINFYRWLQRGCRSSSASRTTRRRSYALRRRFNALLEQEAADTSEAAAIFYT
jgi:DNA adenine methylase